MTCNDVYKSSFKYFEFHFYFKGGIFDDTFFVFFFVLKLICASHVHKLDNKFLMQFY